MNRLIYAVAVVSLLVMSNAKAQESAYERYLRTGQFEPRQVPQPNFDQLRNNLATYQGRPLDEAINNFGPPDAQRTIGGRKLYIWAVNSTQEIPAPGMAITDGTVGGQTFSTTTYGGGSSVSMNAHCKVTMEVDDQQVVKHVWYDGNMAGCSEFLKPASASTTER